MTTPYDPDAEYDDGLTLIAGVLYDAETGEEAELICDICGEEQHRDGGPWHPDDWNGETGCHLSCEKAEPADWAGDDPIVRHTGGDSPAYRQEMTAAGRGPVR